MAAVNRAREKYWASKDNEIVAIEQGDLAYRVACKATCGAYNAYRDALDTLEGFEGHNEGKAPAIG